MSDVSERRRKPRAKVGSVGEPVWVMLLNVPGASSGVRAKVIEANDLGIGIETDARLEPNTLLSIEGLAADIRSNGKAQARVVDSKPFQSVYRAGLTFENGHQNGNGPVAASTEAVPDYYELLQISPNADPD